MAKKIRPARRQVDMFDRDLVILAQLNMRVKAEPFAGKLLS
jgi:hypothetical protein